MKNKMIEIQIALSPTIVDTYICKSIAITDVGISMVLENDTAMLILAEDIVSILNIKYCIDR